MKILTNRPAYKFAEFLLATGLVVLGGAIVQKVLYIKTGDEIAHIRRFTKNGQKGAVIDGDSFLMKPKQLPALKSK